MKVTSCSASRSVSARKTFHFTRRLHPSRQEGQQVFDDTMSTLELPDRSMAALIIESTVCLALNIISITGNSLVCLAVYRNRNLRSTTNVYIVALAISDLLVAMIEMPLASATLIIGRFDFGFALCQIQGFIGPFATYVTPATMGLTAFNRYKRIVKANSYNKIFSPCRSKIWVCCLWMSLALYLLIGRLTGWLNIGFIRGYAVCAFTYPTAASQIVQYTIMVGVLFFIPLCIGIFSYYKIFFKTSQHQQIVVPSLQNTTNANNTRARRCTVKEINISRVLLYVGAGFLCCWIPLWALALWKRFSPETCPRIAELLVTFFRFLSSTINPFIYTFNNNDFRKEFRKLLGCPRGARTAPNDTTTATENEDLAVEANV
ncbi:melatonin receptor type 1A-like [Stylophora pistillata]|uniref:melatonin receptor type 1A-like n=1 Tax=Stylophora pistillata TaxID=50429 RepID=UPI000C046F05|nr:melatonin receptor type 1A-like [Stylophora pistillata]